MKKNQEMIGQKNERILKRILKRNLERSLNKVKFLSFLLKFWGIFEEKRWMKMKKKWKKKINKDERKG